MAFSSRSRDRFGSSASAAAAGAAAAAAPPHQRITRAAARLGAVVDTEQEKVVELLDCVDTQLVDLEPFFSRWQVQVDPKLRSAEQLQYVKNQLSRCIRGHLHVGPVARQQKQPQQHSAMPQPQPAPQSQSRLQPSISAPSPFAPSPHMSPFLHTASLASSPLPAVASSQMPASAPRVPHGVLQDFADLKIALLQSQKRNVQQDLRVKELECALQERGSNPQLQPGSQLHSTATGRTRPLPPLVFERLPVAVGGMTRRDASSLIASVLTDTLHIPCVLEQSFRILGVSRRGSPRPVVRVQVLQRKLWFNIMRAKSTETMGRSCPLSIYEHQGPGAAATLQRHQRKRPPADSAPGAAEPTNTATTEETPARTITAASEETPATADEEPVKAAQQTSSPTSAASPSAPIPHFSLSHLASPFTPAAMPQTTVTPLPMLSLGVASRAASVCSPPPQPPPAAPPETP